MSYRKTLLVFSMVLSSTSTLPAFPAAEGSSAKGGGDIAALEFIIAAREIAKNIPQSVDFDLTKFREAVEQTRVVSIDRTYLNGFEVDAINYPTEKRIELNRYRWLSNVGNPRQRLLLAMHEYLSLIGEPDSNYAITSKYVNWVEQRFLPAKPVTGRTYSGDATVYATDSSGSKAGPNPAFFGLTCEEAKKHAGDKAVLNCVNATGGSCKMASAVSVKSWSEGWCAVENCYVYCKASAIAVPTL
jgi:hypothetical protein